MADIREYDPKIAGLYLRTRDHGKAYFLRYRFNGIVRNPKLGDAAVLNWEAARSIAKELLIQVAKGLDPSLERQEKRKERTLGAVFQDCWTNHWEKKKTDWAKEAGRLYEKEIEPLFGSRKLSDIRASEIRAWHSEYLDSSPYIGNRALAVLSKLYSYAESKEWRPINSNPCQLVKNHKEEKRERYATTEEIRDIGKILQREYVAHPKEVTFMCLLLLTGARPSSIENAKREDMDILVYQDQEFGVVKVKGKTGIDKISIPPQALSMIYNLNTSDTGTLTGTNLNNCRVLWKMIKKETGIEDLWLRDFRRTFATIGMSGGQGMALISELLNHKSQQTTMIYAKLVNDSRLQAVGSIAEKIGGFLK